jgi:ADP-dependent NAD(P)H-hydrate dehydratase / NAD(P)H-hydrate epimerase
MNPCLDREASLPQMDRFVCTAPSKHGLVRDTFTKMGTDTMHDTNEPSLWLDHFHWPGQDDHKYRRGHVLVWGGPRMVGAARLAARAAARAGAGLVTLMVPASVWPVYAAHLMSAMAQPLPDESPDELLRSWHLALSQAHWQVLILGPGARAGLPGDARALMRELVLAALLHEGEQTLVLDADALTAFEGSEGVLTAAIQRSSHPVVMTPHEGEFARLFRACPVVADGSTHRKVEQTQWAAQVSGATVVHKGARTVVAHPAGRVVVNAHAPAWLATAGAGDVLTGFVAALCAQGMPLMEATAMAVWLHGDCALALGPGLLSEDLPEQVPHRMRALKPV